ncbi:hypothetical protein ABW20_dc0105389 [Dactylellina cionopaga]|nr:hypothetical protein ABW20_dc0105389 [Dactylellina cionopaga]
MLAIASAAPSPDIKERDTTTGVSQLETRVVKVGAGELEKRDQGSCWIHYWHGGGVWPDWYFRLDTWGEWDDDWGAGLLDNIRGKCFIWDYVWDWGFYYDSGPPPTWGHATFKVPGAFTQANWECVADAVAAASWNWGPITAQIDAAGSKWW